MIAIPLKKVDNQISKHKIEIDDFIKKIKEKISELLVEPKKDIKIIYTKEQNKRFKKALDYYNYIKSNNCQINYVKYLIDNLEEIVFSKPDDIVIHKAEFQNKLDFNQIDKKFKDILIEMIGYKNLRKNFYPKYFNGLGIKACVYCNSQLTIVSNGSSAHFEVDHYLPKDKFPCFAISFFNLYPVCGSCNKRKLNKKVEFELYKDNSKTDFLFKIERSSLANYLVSNNISDIDILFEDSNDSNFENVFRIEGIYNTQKDIAEELILKSKIYTESYKKSLQESFKLNIGKRIIIGNYSEEDEIHNRPMAKFTQDIAKQLGLV